MKSKLKIKPKIKTIKLKKPMVNSETATNKPVIKYSATTAIKMGEWTENENSTLLGTTSNWIASIILKRTPEACASRRYILRTKEGRRSVQMKRMTKEVATKAAYEYLNKIRKDKEVKEENKNTTDVVDPTPAVNKVVEQPNNNIQPTTTAVVVQPNKSTKQPVQKKKKPDENLTPVIIEEGFTLLLNDLEIVLKSIPNKLIIKGEKLSVTMK